MQQHTLFSRELPHHLTEKSGEEANWNMQAKRQWQYRASKANQEKLFNHEEKGGVFIRESSKNRIVEKDGHFQMRFGGDGGRPLALNVDGNQSLSAYAVAVEGAAEDGEGGLLASAVRSSEEGSGLG